MPKTADVADMYVAMNARWTIRSILAIWVLLALAGTLDVQGIAEALSVLDRVAHDVAAPLLPHADSGQS
jgi:hypothetical protein